MIVCFICLFIIWFNEPCYVINRYSGITPVEIKKAMYKMGPLYKYKMVDDILYVYLDNQWQKLEYK